ncbi:MAG: hypothetical protein HKO10_05320, partial [Acidimicrobiia bacterium]|nr:hypothetical protein [Acidimicrobiia bacterium]
WGAGIAVAGSPNVEIVGNIVIGNADGIVAIQQDRTDAPASYGPVEVENLSVHDNQIRGNVGWTGLGQDVGDDSFFTSRNNRFFDNDYGEDDDPSSFYWLNGERTRTEWTSFGLS